MVVEVPEFKEMIEAAQLYIEGKMGLLEFHGYIEQCRYITSYVAPDSALHIMAEDWSKVINECLNEWGMNKNPLSEEDFKSWLKIQM